MNRAVFLDRDGTLNREVNLLHTVSQLRILPGVPAALRALRKMGYLTIAITNQSVVARGLATEEGVERIHAVLQARLHHRGAMLDGIYYCPHHPNANLRKYRKNCRCRKPNTGMIDKAVRDFNIDRRRSFVVGDHTRDILLAKRAKITSILVETGYGGKDGHHDIQADYVAKDLAAAVRIIKRHAK